MTIPAVVDDIATRWRPLSITEQDTAYARLEDAWAMLRHRVPGIEARMGVELDVRIVISVLCDMVIRVLDPPKRSEQIGNYSASYAVDSTESGIYVTQTEINRLMPTQVGRGGAFTVRQRARPCVAYPLSQWSAPGGTYASRVCSCVGVCDCGPVGEPLSWP